MLKKNRVYSSKKVKDHYCVAVVWKSSPTDIVRHLWPLYWCCGPGLCGYGRKRPSVPGLCQWVGCMVWPDPPLVFVSTEHVWDILQKHISSRPAQPQMVDDLANALIEDWARMGPSAIRKLIRSFTFMRTVVFDASGDQALYLLNFVCDLKHVTMLCLKLHAPTTNMQTFKFR